MPGKSSHSGQEQPASTANSGRRAPSNSTAASESPAGPQSLCGPHAAPPPDSGQARSILMEARARACVCHMVCARERPRERECKLTFTFLWLPDSPAPTSHPLPRDFLRPLSGCLPAHHGTAGTGAPSKCPLLDSARVTRHRPRGYAERSSVTGAHAALLRVGPGGGHAGPLRAQLAAPLS